MCTRYCLTSPPDSVRALFGLSDIDPFPPRYNIAPSQPVAIIRTGAAGVPECALVRWGLIPGWVKDPGPFAMLVNARAETAPEKPSFRGAFRHRRCIIPANGFYEWSGRARARVPHLIRGQGAPLLALAGLWEHWLGADGSEIETMAILTVPAFELLLPIHDRMPVILAPENFAAWLDCRTIDTPEAIKLLAPVSPDAFECLPLGARLNDPRSEGPDLHSPAPSPLSQPRLL
jgi:putative SOS response-associated peptidase YedK